MTVIFNDLYTLLIQTFMFNDLYALLIQTFMFNDLYTLLIQTFMLMATLRTKQKTNIREIRIPKFVLGNIKCLD